ncbi:hypothetical protein J6590_106878 [Homalodisca vitripennis]|nr:hypothetical protein J6590_106878 [Homalodisca vitripennis]
MARGRSLPARETPLGLGEIGLNPGGSPGRKMPSNPSGGGGNTPAESRVGMSNPHEVVRGGRNKPKVRWHFPNYIQGRTTLRGAPCVVAAGGLLLGL